MNFHDWKDKLTYLPYFDFLKTDAAEAEILTGLTDRRAAAKQLYEWGAKEILISHNSEMLVYDGKDYYTCPVKARNLSGRTGRGDTTFGAYLAKRMMGVSIPDALLFATAAVSLKMETPVRCGPEQAVLDYIKEFTPESIRNRFGTGTYLIFFPPSAVILVFPRQIRYYILIKTTMGRKRHLCGQHITIKDIARIAGVSTSTVSRALSNSPELSEQTRQQILEICRQEGYRVNALARSLICNKTNVIGLIVPEVTNPVLCRTLSRHRNARTQPRLQHDPVQWAE